MLFELIGTIVAGVAVALLFWAVNRTLLKGRLPSWLMPVSAGLAMLISTISLEYGWYNRTSSRLPAGFVVATTVEEATFYRPWTYAFPYTVRFMAVDQASTKTHPQQPDQRLVDLFIYERWTKTEKVPALFDCANAQSANIADGIEFGDNGEVLGADWIALNPADPVMQAACQEV